MTSANTVLQETVTPSAQIPPTLDWHQRQALVRELVGQIAEGVSSPETMGLLQRLARDPKCEVRKEVADQLEFLPKTIFPKLTAILIDDANAFVRRSAQRALDRRQRGAESIAKKRRSLEYIETEYARIEKIHGEVVARKARHMAERLYDVLVGATVHDMRNIITPLASSIVSLQQKQESSQIDASDLAKHLPRMRRQVDWLNRMLDDMKTYSQCTPDTRHRERVETLVGEAVGMARDALHASGRLPDCVHLKITIAHNLTLVVARDHWVRAISNIVKNAYEAFATSSREYRSGTISILARSIKGQRIEIVVKDNGVGLSADDLAEVRRFVPGGTSKAGGGTGFGLPTARRMIEAQNGSLAIESQEGVETVVTITMPMAMEGDLG